MLRAPGRNGGPVTFILYIVVCSFFILNLFVGVVITTYNREKEKLGKNFLLTESLLPLLRKSAATGFRPR